MNHQAGSANWCQPADLKPHWAIHPHPGPAIQLWCCNCGRGTGTMEFVEHARANRVPILAIQEDGLKVGERSYFHRYVNKHHYRLFDGPSQIRRD